MANKNGVVMTFQAAREFMATAEMEPELRRCTNDLIDRLERESGSDTVIISMDGNELSIKPYPPYPE